MAIRRNRTRGLLGGPHRIDLKADEPRLNDPDFALDALKARGLDNVQAVDLEVYRLIMKPRDFRKLCRALDRAVADHWRRVNQADGHRYGDAA